ncbi:MAG: CHASE2 domain-containing protein [Anaerolineales bacterium]|nr:CHASE2 domain-containing protein [Anaerolineales bacterium]
MRPGSLRRQSVALITVVVIAMLAAGLTGLLDGLELQAVNLAFQVRGAQPPRSPVVIVAIDDYTFANSGLQWPWPRTYFAQLVDQLAAGGARLIALDVFFREPELFKPAVYTVQGESFLDIAQRYGVSAADLRAANQLDNAGTICGGQTLTIPTQPAQTHVVLRDTLEGLAARYHVSLADLLNANPSLDAPCQITPGLLLQIPVFGPVTYTAVAGDDVAGVAGRFQVNALAVLDEAGQPAQDPLTPGQTLTILFGDGAFAAAVRSAGNVVLNGEVFKDFSGDEFIEVRKPVRALSAAAAGFGITNIQHDADGAVHSVLAWENTARDPAQGEVYYTWPVVLASLYTGQPLAGRPALDRFQFGEQTVRLDRKFLRVNFRGPAGTVPVISALKVVNGDQIREDPDAFRGKIVLIGATSASLQDIYPTPFGFQQTTSGVEVMANALDTVLSGETLTLWSGVCAAPAEGVAGFLRLCALGERTPMLLSILISGGLGLLLLLIREPTRAILALGGLLAAGVALWLAAFLVGRTEIPLVAPLVTLFVAFAAPAVERAVSEELEKRRVRGIFELFISPEMVGQLIDKGIDAMRGKRAELTILFSDIRGFTTMSEKMTPEELVATLNEYLGVMTEVIHRHGGTVDKYEGDLVMAFFGAPLWYPDHAERAVRCSIDMRLELDRLRAKWAAEGKPSHLEMGIGLNSAEVFVGLVGSGRRVNYTVMGDGVNLASRVQDLTKDLQWPLLITEFTYAQVKDQFDIEFGEARLVKGKTVPVGMYKVLGEKGAPAERRVRALFT